MKVLCNILHSRYLASIFCLVNNYGLQLIFLPFYNLTLIEIEASEEINDSEFVLIFLVLRFLQILEVRSVDRFCLWSVIGRSAIGNYEEIFKNSNSSTTMKRHLQQ